MSPCPENRNRVHPWTELPAKNGKRQWVCDKCRGHSETKFRQTASHVGANVHDGSGS